MRIMKAVMFVSCIVLAGCNILNVFDACLASASALTVSVTASSDATPAQKAEVLAWGQTLTVGVAQAAMDVSTGGTVAQIATKVTADMALTVAQAQQLTGLPKDLAAVVAVTMASVDAILRAYQPPALEASYQHVLGNPVAISAKDRAHLGKIRTRALAIGVDAQGAGR